MKLNPQHGNMYPQVNFTGNAIKGDCPHQCPYCYMMDIVGKQGPPHLDERELTGTIIENKYIFIGSSIDMWADSIPKEWISRTLKYLKRFNNMYLFQSKNPRRFIEFKDEFPDNIVLATTIETDKIWEDEITFNRPTVTKRFQMMIDVTKALPINLYMLTIEPIMDFGHGLYTIIEELAPSYITIGADTKDHHLKEPSKEKVLDLIDFVKERGYKEGQTLFLKKGLRRLL